MNCINCGIEISSKRKFCGNSCSAKYNNSIRYAKILLNKTDTKVCRMCKEEKLVGEFNERKGSVDGYRNDCKICQLKVSMENPKRKDNKKKYYQKYKEKIKERSKRWYKENRKEALDNKKEYAKNNRGIINKSRRNRYYSDVIYKLERNIRGTILKALKRNGYTKKSRTYEIIGCSFEEFKIYIEEQFKEGMHWENHGEWHLDHKIPISWADSEDKIYELSKFTNFQPLWSEENLKKKNYYSD